jgi:hypothetical protein
MQMKSRLAGPAACVVTALTLGLLFLSASNHRDRNMLGQGARKSNTDPAVLAVPASSLLKHDWTNAYGKLPLAFEPNQGQTTPQVRYLSRGNGYELFLTNHEAVLALRKTEPARAKEVKNVGSFMARHKPRGAEKISVLRMQFDGANPEPEIAGMNLLPGRVSYFIGNDPKKWHTDIPSYEAVKYKDVYPGVDVLFYGRQQHMEYDFVVAPGGDPNSIALNIQGAHKLEISSHGDLVMSVAAGTVALQKPVVYQEINGERREIAGSYSIANDRKIHFLVAGYDHARPLTIDPVLNYSTYIGGESFDLALGIALDAAGNAYIAGNTSSTTFPQMNPETSTTPTDVALGTAFVSELNPTGTALLYSTYIGGSGNGTFGDGANAIAVDTSSPANVYITGFTGSPDFPVSTSLLPFQGTPGPASTATAVSAFITKLTPSASASAQLAYSSYLGGNTFDEGEGIAVDGSGNAFIAGETKSINFPQKGTQITAGQTSVAGNAFLTEINTTVAGGPSLVYSTYLGGSSAGSSFFGFADFATAVAIDGNSNAYVVGGTASTDFPTAGTAIPGSAACGANTRSSAFVSVINTTTATLGYSHCLTGNNVEIAFGVNLGTGVPAVATKVAYITGETGSSNFPVSTNSIPPPSSVVNRVAFVALVDTNSPSPLQYSTFLGGTNSDAGFSIGSDAMGNAYVAGATDSADFPITQGALQEKLNNPTGMAFISKISPNGNGLADLVYSTYFGGQTANTLTTPDTGQGIAVSGTNAYITGEMASPDMPVSSGAFQMSLRAAGATANAFVADLPLVPTISASPASINFGTQLVGTPTTPAQIVTLTNNTSSAITLTQPFSLTGANPADFLIDPLTTTCTSTLAASNTCTIGLFFNPSNPIAESATLSVFNSADTPAHPIKIALTGTGTATAPLVSVMPTSLTFSGQLLTTTSPTQPVVVKNTGNLPLIISKVAVGTSAFTETDNCVGTIAPLATCTVTVTFAPQSTTAPGTVTDAITVTDNANGSPQSVPLTGTAWDFSVSASSVTVGKGAMGTFSVTVTGLGGFTGPVAFACTPGTLISACAVPTTNAAPSPGATAAGTITAMALAVPPPSMKVPPSMSLRQLVFAILAISLLIMIPKARRFRTRVGMAGAMLAFVLVAGCSGGSSTPKTSTITITPSSGGVTKAAITVNVSITH